MADNLFGHILAEHASDIELLAAFGGVTVGRGQPETQSQGQARQHRVGPETGPEGQDRQPRVEQQQPHQGGQGDQQAGKVEHRGGDGHHQRQGPDPEGPAGQGAEEVPLQQVIQQGGVDLHSGIDSAHGGGLEVQQARGGEAHQDPLAGKVRRRVNGGQLVAHPSLGGDDVGRREAPVAAAGAAIFEQQVALGVHRNFHFPHQQAVFHELQGLVPGEAVKRSKTQGGQPTVFKGQDQGHPPVDAVRVRPGFHVAQGLDRVQKRGDGGGHRAVSGLPRGPGTGNLQPGLIQQGGFQRIGPLFLPGQEEGEDHVARRGRGLGQALVILGAVGRGLGEEHVEDYCPRPTLLAIIDDVTVELPGPGPDHPLVLEEIQVGLVHRHHHHLGRGRGQGHVAEEQVQGLEAERGEGAG